MPEGCSTSPQAQHPRDAPQWPGAESQQQGKTGGTKHGIKGGYPKEQLGVKSKAKPTQKSPSIAVQF